MSQTASNTFVVSSDGQSAGTVVFRVTAVPETPAVPATLGTPIVVDGSTPWQSRSYSFTAVAGQRFSVQASAVALTSDPTGWPAATLELISPSGIVTTIATLADGNPTTNYEFSTNGPAGTWTMRFDPSGPTVGTATLTISALPQVVVPVQIDERLSARATKPNTALYFTSPGRARAPLPMVVVKSLSLSNATAPWDVTATLQFEQAGATVGSPISLNPTNAPNYSFVAPAELNPGQPWRLVVLPGSTTIGSISIVVLDPQTTVRTVAPDAVTHVTFRGVGDVTKLRISAKAGQRIFLEASNVTVPNSAYNAVVARADGTYLATGVVPSYVRTDALTSASTIMVTLQAVPGATYGGSFDIIVHLVTDPVQKAAATNRMTWTRGQEPRLTYTTQPGKHPMLTVTGFTTSSPMDALTVDLVDPAGWYINLGWNCVPIVGCFLEVPPTPSPTQPYTLVFHTGISTGSLTTSFAQVADIQQTATLGKASTVTFKQPGQNARLTFTVTTGTILNWSAVSDVQADLTLQNALGWYGSASLPTGASTGRA